TAAHKAHTLVENPSGIRRKIEYPTTYVYRARATVKNFDKAVLISCARGAPTSIDLTDDNLIRVRQRCGCRRWRGNGCRRRRRRRSGCAHRSRRWYGRWTRRGSATDVDLPKTAAMSSNTQQTASILNSHVENGNARESHSIRSPICAAV